MIIKPDNFQCYHVIFADSLALTGEKQRIQKFVCKQH